MEPKYYESAPKDFPKYPKLTYDEFLPYEDKITVSKIRHGNAKESESTILDAAKSMRSKAKRNPKLFSYTIILTSDSDLDRAFSLPKEIEAIDLHSNFWPFQVEGSFMRKYSKLFHGYPKDYKSALSKRYAGQSEWLHLISGSMKIDVIQPTTYNLAILDCDSGSRMEEGSKHEFIMKEGSFLMIPGGWITKRSAIDDSFMFGGEYLHYHDISNQLECFERDVIENGGSFATTRDSEIRALYWFTAAQLLDNQKAILQKLSLSDLEVLKNFLLECKKKYKTNTVPPDLYGPIGLNLDLITKDLGQYIRAISSKKLLKSKKDSHNVLMDQTSAYNQTN